MEKIMEALNIIYNASTEKQKKDWELNPWHDQIRFWSEDIKLTSKELERLEELWWFIENESWSVFC